MSLAYEKLNAVEVRDPRTIVQTQRDYAILKSGSQTTWKAWTSTSISNSSIQFSMPPPSGGIFVDSKQYFYLPVRLTFQGTPPASQTIIQDFFDAPRAYPISGSIDTLSATINNQSVSINLADIIHALGHYNTDSELKEGCYSTFPAYPDQSQQYNDLTGASRNPLAPYEAGLDGTPMQRGGFSYVVIQNPAQNAVAPFIPLTAIVDVAFCEPIFLPPFYFGNSNRQAFFNVNSLDFNFTFVGNVGNRMWSHDDKLGTNVATVTASFGGIPGGPTFNPLPPFTAHPTWATLIGGTVPLILTQYITPQETQLLSPNIPCAYPYFDIQRYPTQQSVVPSHTSAVLISNNIQLSSIPRRMYVYIRDSNNALQSSCSLTDTYFAINNLSIQFMNKNGLLASAAKQSIYQMSKKNHCNLSWTQWSGVPTGTAVNGAQVFGPGSVACIEFATDIGLDSLDAPGKLGQFMLQVQVTAENLSERDITPTLYLVPVLEGVFEITKLGNATINIGVITSDDILNARAKPGYSYADVEAVQGGNFFSGIKDYFTNKVLPALKDFVNTKGVSRSLAYIPHPAAQIASKAADFLGYGDDDDEMHMGGVMAGGRMMHKKALHHRMKHY